MKIGFAHSYHERTVPPRRLDVHWRLPDFVV